MPIIAFSDATPYRTDPPPFDTACFDCAPTRWSLLLSLTLSVTLKCHEDDGSRSSASNALREYPWLECLAPLWALDVLYAAVMGYVAVNTCAGRFVMAPTQGLCFVLFVVALVGSTIAELLLTGDNRCGVRCVGVL